MRSDKTSPSLSLDILNTLKRNKVGQIRDGGFMNTIKRIDNQIHYARPPHSIYAGARHVPDKPKPKDPIMDD